MGIYTEYLDKQFSSFQDLTDERKKQLKRISDIRGRDVLVYAADLKKGQAQIHIMYSDLMPINDQLSNLNGKAIDLILETPGGFGEVAEQIIRIIRSKYDEFSVIIPGVAKSAGTIMAMAGDEILMEPFVSALGPIDAQLNRQGNVFSAEALIEGFEKIKQEVSETSQLNKAYVPILQGISPGDLEHAQNALDFAKEIVTDWLVEYKFKNWNTHRTKGKPTYNKPVTLDDKKGRAEEIAGKLCKHSHWKTHNRSITLADLESMRLEVTDYSKQADLADAIRRYFILLEMTFDTAIYKVFETPNSQIYRYLGLPADKAVKGISAESAVVDVKCNKCKNKIKIQANFKKGLLIEKGSIPFPPDNQFKCIQCGAEADLSSLRKQIEAQTKKKIES